MGNKPSALSRKAFAVLCAVLLSCCCVFLVACGQSDEDAVRGLVTEELDKVKNLDEETLEGLIQDSQQLNALEEYGITAKDMYTAMFGNFDYRIESVEVKEEKATVGVVFTVKDLSKFQTELTAAAEKADNANSLQGKTAEEINQSVGKLVIDTIEGLPTKQTKETDFTCIKKDGQWKMSSNSASILQEAMFPSSVMNSTN